MESKKAGLIGAESNDIYQGWGIIERGGIGSKVQTSSLKLSKFRGSNVQRDDYGSETASYTWKLPKDLKCSHRKKETVMIRDGGVSSGYGSKHLANTEVCQIRPSYTSDLHNVLCQLCLGKARRKTFTISVSSWEGGGLEIECAGVFGLGRRKTPAASLVGSRQTVSEAERARDTSKIV